MLSLQKQITDNAHLVFKEKIMSVKRIDGHEMNHEEKINAQKKLFRDAQKKAKEEMNEILYARMARIKARVGVSAVDTIRDNILATCNSQADAFFKAFEAVQMRDMEMSWKLEDEKKVLKSHEDFLKKKKAELEQTGLSEPRREQLRKKIQVELVELHEQLVATYGDDIETPPWDKSTEEVSKADGKEDLTLEHMSPELRAMVEKMNNSVVNHNYVYPPLPRPGAILIPTGGLAKCCCSEDCQEELTEPAYMELGNTPGGERWMLNDEESSNSKKTQQKKQKKK